MPRKGHTCCVLGCTVNSKKTELPDGRRPRFFCFPHEKKRPHLRRAWLALTRRTEASTNTRVCEFHFVDGKPSNINPHPILNMGMEPTKMQKRAMELRQQKELRKLLMQQQLAAGGGLIPTQVLPGGAIVTADGQIIGQNGVDGGVQVIGQTGINAASFGFDQHQMGDINQSQISDDAFQMPQHLENMYEDSLMAEGLPSHFDYHNPMSLVVHNRQNLQDELENTITSLGQELLDTTPESEDSHDTKPESDQIENGAKPTSEDLDALPEDYSRILPQDDNTILPQNDNTKQMGQDLDALPEDFSKILPTADLETPTSSPTSTHDGALPSSSSAIQASIIPDIKPENDDEIPCDADDVIDISETDDIQTKSNSPTSNVSHTDNRQSMAIENNSINQISNNSTQNKNNLSVFINGHSAAIENNKISQISNNLIQNKINLPVFNNQFPKPVHNSTPIKVPTWKVQLGQNGALSSAVSDAGPVAKKPRKRKSTPHMIPNVSKSVAVPGMMKNIPMRMPKSIDQSKIIMTMNNVEKMKSDILENLRAEFLTEIQQEMESNKQLKIEMETVRMQTRQELQQMRVELHALWGENQRLRGQVEGLLQEKESDGFYSNANIEC